MNSEMINVVYKEWFVIEKTVFYAFENPNPAYINLAQTLGEDMRYEKLDYELVDYPGEYDIQGIKIQCFLGENQKLNYVIDLQEKKVAIVQSADVLELDEVGSVRFWLYTDDKIAAKMDQLELEGDKQKLEIKE